MLFQSLLKGAVCSATLILVLTSCHTNASKEDTSDNIMQVRDQEEESAVMRGKYLVNAAGCNDCHSPKILTPQGPVVDSTKVLSGHPAAMPTAPFDGDALKPGHWMQMAPDMTTYVGPWGVSYAANLTPDSTTGLGAWTEDVFIKTLRTGRHLGQEHGRQILPPMPWQEFGKMNDNDLKAIYTYLQSLPPVNNKVPVPLAPDEAAKLAKR